MWQKQVKHETEKQKEPFPEKKKKKKYCCEDEGRGSFVRPLRVCIVCLFAVFLEHIFSYNSVQEKK